MGCCWARPRLNCSRPGTRSPSGWPSRRHRPGCGRPRPGWPTWPAAARPPHSAWGSGWRAGRSTACCRACPVPGSRPYSVPFWPIVQTRPAATMGGPPAVRRTPQHPQPRRRRGHPDRGDPAEARQVHDGALDRRAAVNIRTAHAAQRRLLPADAAQVRAVQQVGDRGTSRSAAPGRRAAAPARSTCPGPGRCPRPSCAARSTAPGASTGSVRAPSHCRRRAGPRRAPNRSRR